jgi:hypothetical protein
MYVFILFVSVYKNVHFLEMLTLFGTLQPFRVWEVLFSLSFGSVFGETFLPVHWIGHILCRK